ncbi:MAG: polyphosphate kinase 2 [Lutibacter sp.]|nr:MAG: polyphosphate kinase 2 [Lutibacter sp.]
MEEFNYTEKNLQKLNSKKGLTALLSSDKVNVEKAIRYIDYEKKLEKIQVELVKLQTWAIANNERIIIIFEGRDAAGKGGAIRRLTERINARHYRIVALPKPTKEERTQWYFQRYVSLFPKEGEIILFDRSWYNRAVVEPVNGFCTEDEHELFMNQINDFERMVTESGTRLVKLYMSISKREQAKRFDDIKSDPLKQWKMTKVDEKAQELWDSYTFYKNKMFAKAKEGDRPFKIIRANRKTSARVEVIEHILASIPYDKSIEV